MALEPAGEIVSDIYEAAVVPDYWPAVLGKMSARIDGAGALLFAVSGGIAKGIASPDLQPLLKSSIGMAGHR